MAMVLSGSGCSTSKGPEANDSAELTSVGDHISSTYSIVDQRFARARLVTYMHDQSQKRKSPKRVEIGHRLLELRRAENLTQVEMAKAIGVSLKAYNNYENGVRELPGHLLFSTASKFLVDPTWIYEGFGIGPRQRRAGGQRALWIESMILVGKYLDERGMKITEETKSKIVAALVDYSLAGNKPDEEYVELLLNLVA